MEESGKKWIDKKITRRDFLKKAGMTGAGAVVGASALGGFFANKAENNRAIADGEEKSHSMANTKLELLLLCKNVFILSC